MIQRIQTLYLLAASVLLGLCFYFPVLNTVDVGAVFLMGLVKSGSVLGIVAMVACALAMLLNLVAVFLYKSRKKQMLLCKVGVGLEAVVVVAFVILFLSHSIHVLGMAYLFPCITIVLTWLAYRGIAKDEELVRSLDRLR